MIGSEFSKVNHSIFYLLTRLFLPNNIDLEFYVYLGGFCLLP